MSDTHTLDGFNLDGHSALSRALAQPFEDTVHFIADDVIDTAADYLHDTTGWELPGIHHVDPFYAADDFVDRWFTNPISSAMQPILEWVSPVKAPAPPLVGVETNPGPPKRNKPAPKMAQQQKNSKPAPRPPQAPRQSRVGTATKVSAPTPVAVSYGAGVHIGAPRIKRTNDACILEHTELIADVNGTAAWTATPIQAQPGLNSVYSWLSTQTSGWEKYRYRSLEFIYVSRCGSSTTGSVYLMPDYDASDASPTDEKSGSSFYGSATDVPWKEIVCKIDMRRSRELFLRSGPLPVNLDIKTYDFVTLHVGTTGGAATGWGKIYARYTIELINPQAVAPINIGGNITSGGGGVDANSPFGFVAVIAPGSYISGVSGRVLSVSNLVVGAEYHFLSYITGTGITACNVAVTGLGFKTSVGSIIAVGNTGVVHSTTYLATATSGTLQYTITATTVTGATALFSPQTPFGV